MKGLILLLSLLSLACGPMSERSERTASDPPAVFAWADSVDALADQPGAERSFALVEGGLVAVRDSTEWPDEADAELLVHLDPEGRPLRTLEMPISQSGDWWLGLAHYFDEQGRTKVGAKTVRYFVPVEGCGDGVAEYRVRTVYGPDFGVVATKARLADGEGQPMDESCGSYGHPLVEDDFPGFEPLPTYDALVRAGRAPAD